MCMDKEQKAIARLKEAALMSETYYQKPLVVTTSGGKDSDVCIALALAVGIDFEVQHNHTTADAPETVYHVRSQFRRLEQDGVKCTINYPQYKQRPVTMWTLIPKKLMPPTRAVRYCCAILKEGGGAGRMITTGVRWAESASRRTKRGIYESMPHDLSKKIIINNDNADTRLLFACKGGSEMTRQRALRLAREWAQGHKCTLRDGEAAEYHSMFAAMLEESMSNDPLTLEQLREMDGEPVWFDTIKRWGIVRVCGYGISVLTKSGEYDVTRMKFYRRPPEGEDAK